MTLFSSLWPADLLKDYMSRKQEIQALVTRSNKKYGDGTLLWGSELARDLAPRVPSGSLALDYALGGGWPGNQWNEIVGTESSSKTFMTLKTVATNQQVDPEWYCIWVDAENSYDRKWAARLGVDNERTLVVNTNIAEEVYDIAIEACASRAVDGVVIDSLPALIPSRENDGSMEDFQPGLMAILTGKFFRTQRPASKRSLVVEERPVTGFMINQYRSRLMTSQYGDPRTTPGGEGKNYAYFTRVELRRDEWIETTREDRIGMTVKARVFKNKSSQPQRVASFDIYFADGKGFEAGSIDRMKEVVNLGLAFEIIERNGAWYSYGDGKWNGKEGLVEGLRAEPKVVQQIEEAVLSYDPLQKKALALTAPVEAAAPVTAPKKRVVKRTAK